MLAAIAPQPTVQATPKTMRAVIQPEYGSAEVLRVESVAAPSLSDDGVLVRVHASSVCKGDIFLLTGKPYILRAIGFGLLRPKQRIPGQDIAGRVVAVGRNVSTFQPGDEVYGQPGGGAFAEYVCTTADKLAPKPRNLSFEQAAAVPDSALTALQGLRDAGKLQAGQRVLINGASGGVGSFAVQIAKALGATVTAVCSTRHVDKVRSLGADLVVDYTREDFAQRAERYDVMLDLVGNRSLADCKRVLEPTGHFVASAGNPGGPILGAIPWLLGVTVANLFASQSMGTFMTRPRSQDLQFLSELIEAGKIVPLIEARHPLARAADAVRHVADGHAQGKSVITV